MCCEKSKKKKGQECLNKNDNKQRRRRRESHWSSQCPPLPVCVSLGFWVAVMFCCCSDILVLGQMILHNRLQFVCVGTKNEVRSFAPQLRYTTQNKPNNDKERQLPHPYKLPPSQRFVIDLVDFPLDSSINRRHYL